MEENPYESPELESEPGGKNTTNRKKSPVKVTLIVLIALVLGPTIGLVIVMGLLWVMLTFFTQ